MRVRASSPDGEKMNVLQTLIRFVQHKGVDDWLERELRSVGPKELRAVAIILLDWLRAERGPLMLDRDVAWCRYLHSLMSKPDCPLAELFRCSDDAFDFREELSQPERDGIRRRVQEEYRPMAFFGEKLKPLPETLD